MYGRRASQLLKELDACEAGQLAPFNSDVFDQVIRECNEHNTQFQSLIRKMVEQNLDIETTRNEDHYGAAVHHLSLLRNKRCLMAYMYNRAEVIQSFRWKIGPVLPHEIQEKLHFSEKEYFKNHSAAIKSYISEMDIDLTVVQYFFLCFIYFLLDEIRLPDSLYHLYRTWCLPRIPTSRSGCLRTLVKYLLVIIPYH
ncbi:hypothetical protein E2562_007004 [Oryza meyeriana var. granulata]|uniref:GINS subunit domain-containing protein n=1 Tax=Oryza meyeriana var. granulata TaxID=110450 RepID=A0A6G1E9J8_9ORYZ|nr:hypothetical protein E2562_007004 [Oryza meyeriana var. granulata]KAF0921450.1 hypothetical protein E2562_007004 [Oryza meyeriana var. granulata]KAF0921451.1 hypothetical protein E2562_007004 [Oryza meyeriana var. granulata]KAF0921452.1 hypothetical protein E2562_007004 [Oryza meyeriana var. granulata]KAF0921455.1 hypothetical protein E2562_007004 [Oryza meyeriana var. granulata]